ncbi:MAG TPA: D-alanyl-D-alanine carboxypeptidase/D-alanyl-D-alanine-endopeptidase, partial [Humisphaera sp.]
SRMKHRRPLALLLAAAALGLLPAAAARGGPIDEEVNAVLRDKALSKATLGVQVLKLGTAPAQMAELYAHNSHVPLVPASNLKLVTTATALERLGADFKFRTRLFQRGEDLVLVGDGDPALGDPDFPKKGTAAKPTAVFAGWAKQLRDGGLTSFRDLVVDDSVFDEAFFHPDWPADQMDAKYEAQVGGLNLNANIVDLTVSPTAHGERAQILADPATAYLTMLNGVATGSENAVSVSRQPGTNKVTLRGQTPARSGSKVWATVHDPPMYAGTVLAETLERNGVRMTGQVRRDRHAKAPGDVPGGGAVASGAVASGAAVPAAAGLAGARLVAIHETPLTGVIARANKDSVNLYAEALCKRAAYDEKRGVPGSWETGTAGMAAYLKAIGVPETDFAFVDGCGLSKRNVISPRALARVLCYEYYGANRDAYVRSLSVAGVDGTLDDRFGRSDLRQRVFGKSGYVNGVSTLSGYFVTKAGEWHAFAIMVNRPGGLNNAEVKQLTERIVK